MGPLSVGLGEGSHAWGQQWVSVVRLSNSSTIMSLGQGSRVRSWDREVFASQVRGTDMLVIVWLRYKNMVKCRFGVRVMVKV